MWFTTSRFCVIISQNHNTEIVQVNEDRLKKEAAYRAEYAKKHYDTITVKLPPGSVDMLKAIRPDLMPGAFVRELVRDRIKDYQTNRNRL